MERDKILGLTLHMVFRKGGIPMHETAARKQKEAIGYFLDDFGGTWEQAVEKGYRAMKCFYDAVDKTYESLPKETARRLLPNEDSEDPSASG